MEITYINTMCNFVMYIYIISVLSLFKGGLGEMKIPLLADKSTKIARDYNVLDEDSGIPFRGLYIIDGNQKLRQITVNDLPVGR